MMSTARSPKLRRWPDQLRSLPATVVSANSSAAHSPKARQMQLISFQAVDLNPIPAAGDPACVWVAFFGSCDFAG